MFLKCIKHLQCCSARLKQSVILASYRHSSSSSSDVHAGKLSPLYELREYDIRPSEMKKFTSLTVNLYHLRTCHSKLVGHWTVEYGAINQFLHIWQYDSYAHRATVRAKLAADDEWNSKYVSKAFPMITKQSNVLMRSVPGYHVQPPPHNGGTYGITVYSVKNDHTAGVSLLTEMFAKWSEVTQGHGHIVGAWEAEYGPSSHVVLLDHYPCADIRATVLQSTSHHQHYGGCFQENVKCVDVKGLVPSKVSPLQ